MVNNSFLPALDHGIDVWSYITGLGVIHLFTQTREDAARVTVTAFSTSTISSAAVGSWRKYYGSCKREPRDTNTKPSGMPALLLAVSWHPRASTCHRGGAWHVEKRAMATVIKSLTKSPTQLALVYCKHEFNSKLYCEFMALWQSLYVYPYMLTLLLQLVGIFKADSRDSCRSWMVRSYMCPCSHTGIETA